MMDDREHPYRASAMQRKKIRKRAEKRGDDDDDDDGVAMACILLEMELDVHITCNMCPYILIEQSLWIENVSRKR